VSVGGYVDHEFKWREGVPSTFDQHRLIPFLYSRISDRLLFSTEIEYEHGGFVSGEDETDGEIKIEYAVLDFSITEALNFRGGIILSPLGTFNLLHDSPPNDLTERPSVDRLLIPTTLSESGFGVYGSLYPSVVAVLSYEIYLVNGFDARVLQETNGTYRLSTRDGRGSQKQDNNDNKALLARIGFSPRIGVSVGASVHTGDYDDGGTRNLTIAALDGKITRGPLEFLGEAALVHADVDGTAHPGAADDERGAYAQVNLHVLHDRVLPGSVFTLVARGDWVDFDADHRGDREERLTLGINFRPVEDTVFKLDYSWTWTASADADAVGPRDALFLSLASYF
jgi:hypothetical protein